MPGNGAAGSGRLSLDLDCGESRLRLEPSHDLTPERLFERQWVLTLLDLVMRRLQEEYAVVGQGGAVRAAQGSA